MKYTMDDVHAEIAELINSTGSANTRTADMLANLFAALEAAEARESVLKAEKEALLSFNDTADKEIYLLRVKVARLCAHVYAIEILLAEHSKGKAPYWEGYSDGLDEAAHDDLRHTKGGREMKDAIEDVIGNILNCAAGQYDIEALEQVLERIAALEAAEAENAELRARVAVHDRTFTNQVLITMEPDELSALIADVRRQAMEEAAGICDNYDNGDYPADQWDCARLIRAKMGEGK